METENWINEILNSTNGITQVKPSENLFQKIELKVQQNRFSNKTLWLVAASIVVLVTINISLLICKNKSEDASTNTLATTLNKSNQLY